MSQEVRDKLARLEGWTKNDAGYWVSPGGTELSMGGDWHPIMDDLTTCAAMWDKYAREHGYRWNRTDLGYSAWKGTFQRVCAVSDTGTDAAAELRDRWALLDKVLKSMGK